MASHQPCVGSALNWHGQPYEQLQLISSRPWISHGVMAFSFCVMGVFALHPTPRARLQKVSPARRLRRGRLIPKPARDTVASRCAHPEVHMLARKLVAVLLLLVSGIASAAWPEKTVRIIIPWPPGYSTDIVGRILAADLTNRLKHQVLI